MRDTWRGRALDVVIGLAVTLFCAVIVVLLVLDPRVTASDAIRTGGLVGGGVVALYALWLNDRRRRVEESRHELERRTNEQDRERVADETFFVRHRLPDRRCPLLPALPDSASRAVRIRRCGGGRPDTGPPRVSGPHARGVRRRCTGSDLRQWPLRNV